MERHTAIPTFKNLLHFIVDSLQQMTQWKSLDTQKTVQTLLNAIAQPTFIISMMIFKKFQKGSDASDCSNLANHWTRCCYGNANHIESLLEAFAAFRHEEIFTEIVYSC